VNFYWIQLNWFMQFFYINMNHCNERLLPQYSWKLFIDANYCDVNPWTWPKTECRAWKSVTKFSRNFSSPQDLVAIGIRNIPGHSKERKTFPISWAWLQFLVAGGAVSLVSKCSTSAAFYIFKWFPWRLNGQRVHGEEKRRMNQHSFKTQSRRPLDVVPCAACVPPL